MTNANNIKILYIFFGNNSFFNFGIMNQYNKVIYIADIIYKAGFLLFANIFIVQLYNFLNLKRNKLFIN